MNLNIGYALLLICTYQHILGQSSDKVVNFLEDTLTRSSFLLLNTSLVDLKLDSFIWQGLHISSIPLIEVSKSKADVYH